MDWADEFGNAASEAARFVRSYDEMEYGSGSTVKAPFQSGNFPPKKRMGQAGTVKDELGVTSINVPVMGHIKKSVVEKKPKKVHVSKAFKAKVNKALTSKNVTGYKKDLFYVSWSGLSLPGNMQNVDTNGQVSQQVAYSNWDFLPEYFLDAASVLWNKKAASAGTWSTSSANTIGQGVSPLTVTTVNAVKFYVKNSYAQYLYRNTTARGIHLKIYEARPKRNSFLLQTNTELTGGVGTNQDALQNPAQGWAFALADGINEGYNLSQINNTLLKTDPRASTGFNKGWDIGLVQVFLEPGASYEFKVQGPSDFEWNYQKHVQYNEFTTIAKYSRYIMPVFYMDLTSEASTGTDLFGRKAFKFGGTQGTLGFERKLYVSLQMPEETGFVNTGVLGATGSVVDLGLRKPAYSENVWGNTGSLADVTWTETQPQTGAFTTGI